MFNSPPEKVRKRDKVTTRLCQCRAGQVTNFSPGSMLTVPSIQFLADCIENNLVDADFPIFFLASADRFEPQFIQQFFWQSQVGAFHRFIVHDGRAQRVSWELF